ncbi:unnamed protein product [Blepharisma stoltei]|uniref:RING-type domain-containing protein n=1 Tax=Blepharisma stoltei TaxID=1481888 RepID=A0AAU9IWX4_9CILI|nr:unnamed protein product [Blepharisma stoltei]
MQTLQVLEPVNLSFLDGVLVFQSLQTSSPPISTIIFERLSSIHDYPCLLSLKAPDISSHLCALLYDYADASQYLSSTSILEQVLLLSLPDESHAFIAECSDINIQADFVYLIVHSQDSTGLGCYISAVKMGIFRFSYEELYGSGISAMLGYIKSLKSSRTETIAQYHYMKEVFNKEQKELLMYSLFADKISERTNSAKEVQIKNEETIEALKKSLEIKKRNKAELEAQDLECLICRNSAKNIVFLPCGHILACKECVVDRMKLTLNKVINSRMKSEPCPLCKGRVREAREVSFN